MENYQTEANGNSDKRRKWNWIGNTLRKEAGAIEKTALEWNPQGYRRRGRLKRRWQRTIEDKIYCYYFFYLRTAAFKAYCAIWVRHSNFHHQASLRVSPSESTQRRRVELWARNVREFCLNVDLHVTFRIRRLRTRELECQRPARYL
jgi:hypothetical protein